MTTASESMERLIFDELEAAIDPNAAKSFRMIEQGARRDYGQRFWWLRGAAVAAGVRALLKQAGGIEVKGSLAKATERFLRRQVGLEIAPIPRCPGR